jgi:hypothetical protein
MMPAEKLLTSISKPALTLPSIERSNHLSSSAASGPMIGLVRQPAGRDEQRGDQAPGDERADVRHDHAREVAAETLDPGASPGAF